jgi:hypothetical protein
MLVRHTTIISPLGLVKFTLLLVCSDPSWTSGFSRPASSVAHRRLRGRILHVPSSRDLGVFEQAQSSRGFLANTPLNIGCESPLNALSSIGDILSNVLQSSTQSQTVTNIVDGTFSTLQLVSWVSRRNSSVGCSDNYITKLAEFPLR